MSILLQDLQDGLFKLYTKGADNIILSRLSQNSLDSSLVSETKSYLNKASTQGYRTLLVAMRVLDQSEVENYVLAMSQADCDLATRAEKLEQIYDGLESNLQLIGATVVEDRL